MGSVFVHTMMSVDGFIAGPDDDMGLVFRHAGDMPSEIVDEVVARTGAILGGRRSYEVGRRVDDPLDQDRERVAAEPSETRKPFGGRWSGPIFILTHTPPSDETDPSYRFLSGEIKDAVRTASAAASGRDLLVLGANVVDQCLEAGLVDELLIHVAPELLGDGVRMFGSPAVRAGLDTVAAWRSGEVVNLRIRIKE